MDIITISLALSLVTNLAFSEILGIGVGGMVVPGYMALYLNRPLMILLTIIISYITFFIVHSLSAIMIIYGRRRTVLMILIGFLLGWFIRSLGLVETTVGAVELTIVGYIIPGLIAIWIDRQGALETLSAMITASVIIRLGLILITGGELVL
jgi:poly-gamma-glutamate biosynthesis protein PgsC/CapC